MRTIVRTGPEPSISAASIMESGIAKMPVRSMTMFMALQQVGNMSASGESIMPSAFTTK